MKHPETRKKPARRMLWGIAAASIFLLVPVASALPLGLGGSASTPPATVEAEAHVDEPLTSTASAQAQASAGQVLGQVEATGDQVLGAASSISAQARAQADAAIGNACPVEAEGYLESLPIRADAQASIDCEAPDLPEPEVEASGFVGNIKAFFRAVVSLF